MTLAFKEDLSIKSIDVSINVALLEKIGGIFVIV
jgi:hypothetical protein